MNDSIYGEPDPSKEWVVTFENHPSHYLAEVVADFTREAVNQSTGRLFMALHEQSIGPTAKVLLLAYIAMAFRDGSCNLSGRELAQSIGVSHPTMLKAKEELVEAQLVVITHGSRTGNRAVCDEVMVKNFYHENFDGQKFLPSASSVGHRPTYENTLNVLSSESWASTTNLNDTSLDSSKRKKENTIVPAPNADDDLRAMFAEAERQLPKSFGPPLRLTPPKPVLRRATPRPRPLKRVSSKKVAMWAIQRMYGICYLLKTPQQQRAVTKSMAQRIYDALVVLVESGADLDHLLEYERRWARNWRSKDRNDPTAYKPPSPEKVVETWWELMTDVAFEQLALNKPEVAREIDADANARLHEAMRRRATGDA